MVARGSGQTSVHSLNKIVPTPALGMDDKGRLTARGVLSAGRGRGGETAVWWKGRIRQPKHWPQPHVLVKAPGASSHQASCTGLFPALQWCQAGPRPDAGPWSPSRPRADFCGPASSITLYMASKLLHLLNIHHENGKLGDSF